MLCTTQYDYRLAKVGLKVRAAFVSTIFRKILDVPLAQLARLRSVGRADVRKGRIRVVKRFQGSEARGA